MICFNFISTWCVFYQLDFYDRWTFFELEGYHSFKVNNSLFKIFLILHHGRGNTIFWSFLSFSWPLRSLIFMDFHGTIGPKTCGTIGISELKKVKLCTRSISVNVIFVHFVDWSFLAAVHQTISESGYRMKDLKECCLQRVKL